MAYFKIGEVDFSPYTSSLKVSKNDNFNSQINAAGNTIIDYINSKYTIEVGIIPLDDTVMAQLQTAIQSLDVTISFRDPHTNKLKQIQCIIPSKEIEYYTIQIGKVMYKACTLNFTEL